VGETTEHDFKCVIDLYKDMFRSFGKDLDEEAGTFVQLGIDGSKKLDPEQQFKEAWKSIEKEDGTVNEEKLCEVLRVEFNWNTKQFDKMLQKYKGKGDILVSGGRIRWGKK
jgi:hypothetical protein